MKCKYLKGKEVQDIYLALDFAAGEAFSSSQDLLLSVLSTYSCRVALGLPDMVGNSPTLQVT